MTNKTILPILYPLFSPHGKTLFILPCVSFQKTTLEHRRVYVYKALWVTFKNIQMWNFVHTAFCFCSLTMFSMPISFFLTGAVYSIRWSIVIYLTTSLLVNIKWIQGAIAFVVHELRVFLILLFHLFQNRQYMHLEKWKIAQSCLTLWDPMDWAPPGSPAHGIL